MKSLLCWKALGRSGVALIMFVMWCCCRQSRSVEVALSPRNKPGRTRTGNCVLLLLGCTLSYLSECCGIGRVLMSVLLPVFLHIVFLFVEVVVELLYVLLCEVYVVLLLLFIKSFLIFLRSNKEGGLKATKDMFVIIVVGVVADGVEGVVVVCGVFGVVGGVVVNVDKCVFVGIIFDGISVIFVVVVVGIVVVGVVVIYEIGVDGGVAKKNVESSR